MTFSKKLNKSNKTYMDTFLVCFTLFLVPVIAILAWKKYYKKMKRSTTRAKWIRGHNYTKVNNTEQEGCEDVVIMSDSEEYEADDIQFYGEERRRLLMQEQQA